MPNFIKLAFLNFKRRSPVFNLFNMLFKRWESFWFNISHRHSSLIQKDLHVLVRQVIEWLRTFLFNWVTCWQNTWDVSLASSVFYSEEEALLLGLLAEVLSVEAMGKIVIFTIGNMKPVVPFFLCYFFRLKHSFDFDSSFQASWLQSRILDEKSLVTLRNNSFKTDGIRHFNI